ncbi:flagellar hook-length control protein [Oxalobacteraceae bacterium]|nr:flagellar hook-length control protein [Oxalobacteraceae bacterium]
MSIAVSAIVYASPRLRLLQALFSLCVLSSAGACASTGAAALCAVLGLASLAALRRRPTAQRLDISGVGQLRLTVYLPTGAVSTAEPVVLLAGSTLWPGLLLLRLGHADGRVTTLPLWPGGALRAVAVACRAIAARRTEH